MDHRRFLAAIALAFGATVAASAVAGPVASEVGPNLVTNGGFETGDFSGWTASVDPTYSGVDHVAAHSGNWGAFFGDAGTPGSISQSIATVAGASYDIQLWLRSDGATPNSFAVLWGGTTVFSVADVVSPAYTEILIDPLATSGLTTLELRARNDNGFLEADDISVHAVPEPAPVVLFAGGLLVVVAARRRKA